MCNIFFTCRCHYHNSIFVCVLLLVYSWKSQQWLWPPNQKSKKTYDYVNNNLKRVINMKTKTSKIKGSKWSNLYNSGWKPLGNSYHGPILIDIEGWQLKEESLAWSTPIHMYDKSLNGTTNICVHEEEKNTRSVNSFGIIY